MGRLASSPPWPRPARPSCASRRRARLRRRPRARRIRPITSRRRIERSVPAAPTAESAAVTAAGVHRARGGLDIRSCRIRRSIRSRPRSDALPRRTIWAGRRTRPRRSPGSSSELALDRRRDRARPRRRHREAHRRPRAARRPRDRRRAGGRDAPPARGGPARREVLAGTAEAIPLADGRRRRGVRRRGVPLVRRRTPPWPRSTACCARAAASACSGTGRSGRASRGIPAFAAGARPRPGGQGDPPNRYIAGEWRAALERSTTLRARAQARVPPRAPRHARGVPRPGGVMERRRRPARRGARGGARRRGRRARPRTA